MVFVWWDSRAGLGAVAVVALLAWTSLQMVTHGRRPNCNARKDRHLADQLFGIIQVFHVLCWWTLMSFVTEGPRVLPNARVPIYEFTAAFCCQGLRSGCMGPRSLTRTWAWTLWTAKLPVPAELQKPGKALSLIVPRPTKNMLKGLVVRVLGETLVNGRWVFAMWKSYYDLLIPLGIVTIEWGYSYTSETLHFIQLGFGFDC